MANRVTGTDGDDTLAGTSENDIIKALGGDDDISASTGHDKIDGGDGNDQVDAYLPNQTVFPTPTGPRTYTLTDTRLSDSSGTLDTELKSVEIAVVNARDANVTFDNVLNASKFSGTAYLYGGGGNDTLTGGKGDDYLSPGQGSNKVNGGAGYDTVGVASNLGATTFSMSSGMLIEMSTDGATNTLKNIESVRFFDIGDPRGSTERIDATGIALPFMFAFYYGHATVIGGSGNDAFVVGVYTDSPAAGDVLTGGRGIDTFNIGSLTFGLDGVRITDLAPGERISFMDDNESFIAKFVGSAAFSGVAGQYHYVDAGNQTLIQADTDGDGVADKTLTLTNGTFTLAETARGSNILQIANAITDTGRDTLNGILGQEVIGGLGGSNTINGSTGSDVVDGAAGNGNLRIGLGQELLTGGVDKDVFRFDIDPLTAVNHGTIADYSETDDSIKLEGSLFGGLVVGNLVPGAFDVGSTGHDATDPLIYDSTSGSLIHDAGVSGTGVTVAFAHSSNGLAITNAAFTLF